MNGVLSLPGWHDNQIQGNNKQPVKVVLKKNLKADDSFRLVQQLSNYRVSVFSDFSYSYSFNFYDNQTIVERPKDYSIEIVLGLHSWMLYGNCRRRHFLPNGSLLGKTYADQLGSSKLLSREAVLSYHTLYLSRVDGFLGQCAGGYSVIPSHGFQNYFSKAK